MKKSPMLMAGVVFVALLQSSNVLASDDTTFFGITIGSHFDYQPCESHAIKICSISKQTFSAAIGGQVSQVGLLYPRGMLPDWFVINSTQAGIREDNIESVLFAYDIPSQSIGQKGLKDLYQHLQEKLGPESKREKIDAFGQPYHFVATWNKPYGKVTFETVTQISTSSQLLPVIRVQSNKWIALMNEAEKIRQQQKAETDAKKLKF